MCIICYKPKGVEMPSREVLKAMYRANSDGCGFCTPTKYYRGLSFGTFIQKIGQVGKEEPCIIHFRLATHGSVKRGNCHPFYDATTGTYFAHNGILNVIPDRDTTDSETAFRRLFVPQIRRHGLQSDELAYSVAQVRANTGSKFAFMQGDDVLLFGDFQAYDGCLCSNLRFIYYLEEERVFKNNIGRYGYRYGI